MADGQIRGICLALWAWFLPYHCTCSQEVNGGLCMGDRWGNAKSPAYGTLSDYQFMRRHSGSQKGLEKARAAWGSSLSSIDDVISVFVNYCSGAGIATYVQILVANVHMIIYIDTSFSTLPNLTFSSSEICIPLQLLMRGFWLDAGLSGVKLCLKGRLVTSV